MSDEGNRANERSQSNSSPSNHLPECLLPDFDKGRWVCICHLLRACEQRMLDDDVLAAAYHGEKGYAMGYAVALNAAEAAVINEAKRGVSHCACNEDLQASLAAIRALKEKDND